MGVVMSIGFAGCNTGNIKVVSSAVAYDNSDVNVTYDTEKATKINFSENEINIDGNGIKKDENILIIKKAGTYIFSGTLGNGKIVCRAPEKEVKIVFDNAVLKKHDSSPIEIEDAKKVYIISTEGSNNKVIAGKSDYSVQTNAPLTFYGKGTTEFKGGIESNKNIVFSSGKLNINSVENGIDCEESVTFLGGDTTIGSKKTGISSEKIINVKNGTINIECREKNDDSIAVKANKAISINDGDFNLNSYATAIQCDGDINISGGEFKIKTTANGLSSLNLLNLIGGTFNIESDGASLSAKRVSVSGGYYNLDSEAEGINSSAQNGAQINIDGGTMKVKSQKSCVSTTGSFNMSGGTLVLSAQKSSNALTAEEWGIDGGLCFAVGSNLDIFENAGQTSVLYNFKNTQKKNTRFTLTDGKENVVASFVPQFDYDCVAIVSGAISQNKEYSVFIGGDATEKFSSGIATNGKLENSKKYATIKV